MLVREAQEEVRTVFAGGAVGQAVSGLLWLISAALGTWASPRAAILTLVVGGVLIYPLTSLALRLLTGSGSRRRENPFNGLAMQSAFILPLSLPIVGAAALYNLNWFYPAFMVALGAHYLPFIALYGMWQFVALAALLIGGGVAIAITGLDASFTIGGWFTAALLFLFALLAWLLGWGRPSLT
jgi:hypothetical protein